MSKHKLLINIDDDLKEKLKEIAKEENRTLSNLIETILFQYNDYQKRLDILLNQLNEKDIEIKILKGTI